MPLKIYKTTEAPINPEQGDLRFNVANNQLDQFSGTGWGGITFNAVTTGITTVDQIRPSAGWASSNNATTVFYVPATSAAPVASITSLGGRSAIVVNTVNRSVCIWIGGSWFTSASMSIA